MSGPREDPLAAVARLSETVFRHIAFEGMGQDEFTALHEAMWGLATACCDPRTVGPSTRSALRLGYYAAQDGDRTVGRMPPTPDLHARILAAIDRVEQDQRRDAPEWVPKRYTCPVCTNVVDGWSDNGGLDRTGLQCQFPGTGAEALKIWPCKCLVTPEQWRELGEVRPSPDRFILRRCAADRRILALHPQVAAERAADGEFPTGCQTCHNDMDCGWTKGDGLCETILALAEGYGITVGGESAEAVTA